MQIELFSSLQVYGSEPVIYGNSVIYFFEFNQPFDLEKVRTSYERFIVNRRTLRLKWIQDHFTKSFSWVPFTDDELEERLTRELDSLSTFKTREVVCSEYFPTNTRLPIRFSLIDESTLVLHVNRTFTSGGAGLYWLQDWLQFYEDDSEGIPELPQEDLTHQPELIKGIFSGILGIFWAILYVLKFLLLAREESVFQTVDFSHGRRPDLHGKGYSVRTYLLTGDETQCFIAKSTSEGLSWTEMLTEIIAQYLFEAAPEKNRVCISFPTDLNENFKYHSQNRPGNYSGSMVVQLFRDRPLREQIKNASLWAKLGVPYYLPRLVGILNREGDLLARFYGKALLPLSQRGFFENYSCAISHTGPVSAPSLEEKIKSFRGHTQSETIFFSFGILNGLMSMDVSVSNDLYDSEEVFFITDKIFNGLLRNEFEPETYGLTCFESLVPSPSEYK